MNVWLLIGLALGLGLLGFVEPCTLGAHLVMVQVLAAQPRQDRITQTLVFVVTRMLVMGSIGAGTVLLGQTLFGVQRGLWLLMGSGYLLLGIVYGCGMHGQLGRWLRSRLPPAPPSRPALMLGVLFGMNIPACALPLFLALLTASVGLRTSLHGFVLLALFGFALAVPLVLMLTWPRIQTIVVSLSTRLHAAPRLLGMLFILLGIWTLGLAWTAPPVILERTYPHGSRDSSAPVAHWPIGNSAWTEADHHPLL
jgi:cytochrome c-type biogenesis protein